MQLKIGGILIVPVGEDIQTMTSLVRISEIQFEQFEHGSFRFVPLLNNKADETN